MKNRQRIGSKFMVAAIGLIIGIVGFLFTQIWFILGAGIALSIASIVAGSN